MITRILAASCSPAMVGEGARAGDEDGALLVPRVRATCSEFIAWDLSLFGASSSWLSSSSSSSSSSSPPSLPAPRANLKKMWRRVTTAPRKGVTRVKAVLGGVGRVFGAARKKNDVPIEGEK